MTTKQNYLLNKLPAPTVLNLFANTSKQLKLEMMHPIGCPAYVMNYKLQNFNKVDKWAIIGIFGTIIHTR